MNSNYLDLSKVPEALFHPMVKSQEEIFAFKAGYKPNDNIPPSLDFSKEEMVKIPSMAWMKNHNFILIAPNMPDNTYGTDISVQSSLLDWFKSIEGGCSMFEIGKKERKLVALDLETTGLNTNIRIHGGQITRFEDMVGVCISVSEKDGYYIPILHTEEDGVKNWSLSDVKELIDYITDEEKFVLTLHNAVYDFSILRAHGIRIPKICTDTLILGKLMNNFEFYRYGVQNGLKQLSEYLLERKMIDIHEFFGHKSIVQFNLLSATTATQYGCLDFDSIITVKQFESSQPIKVKIGEAKQYEGWLVDSPDGWVRINKWLDQGVKDTIRLDFEDGNHLICTPDHKIETSNRGWVEAKYLTDIDDGVVTNHQSTKVIWITNNKLINVYDLAVEHNNHKFYANNISVHNCSDAINSISLHHYFVTNDVDGRNPWKYQPLNCIHFDSIITVKQLEDSQPIKVKIGEAKKYEGWLVDSPDGWVRITKWLDQGVKDTIRLDFEDGSHLICTPDHKIETSNRGWVEAQYLTDMDDVISNHQSLI